jgi:hypothetical protein
MCLTPLALLTLPVLLTLLALFTLSVEGRNEASLERSIERILGR